MDDSHEASRETAAVTFAEGAQSQTGDVVTPIHLSSTFRIPGLVEGVGLEDFDPAADEFLYSRLSNPTRHALERRLAALEDADHGFAFSSGTAAITTALFAVVQPGDHVVAFDDLYAGTRRLLDDLFSTRLGVDVSYVDATDPVAVADAVRPETAMLWMETPTNPLLKLCDIEAMAEIADAADAVLAVDNTFLSPMFQQPLALGADLVAHSTTKYINGHSDAVGGALVTNDDALAEQVGFLQQVALGNMLAPFDSYLVSRGMKTLPLRMERHETNALAVAEYLEAHDCVRAVHYPGLESHPQHDLACTQMDGFGGVLSFELVGGFEEAQAFLGALEEISLAVSLGGVESLVEHPAGMTHEPLGREAREAIGISDTLVRLSVGVETVADLVADLERGFDAMAVDELIAD
jgi:cystathionine gamma-lyase